MYFYLFLERIVCSSLDELEDAPAEDIAYISPLLEDNNVADDVLPFNSHDGMAEAEKLIIQNTFLFSGIDSEQMNTIRPFNSVSLPIQDDVLKSNNNELIPTMKSEPVPNLDLSGQNSIFDVKKIKPSSPIPKSPVNINHSDKLPVPDVVSPIKSSVRYEIADKPKSSKRIDSLKLYLERAIGLDCMVDCYMILHQASIENIEITNPLIAEPLSKLIPSIKMKYVPLIQELIKLENE